MKLTLTMGAGALTAIIALRGLRYLLGKDVENHMEIPITIPIPITCKGFIFTNRRGTDALQHLKSTHQTLDCK